MIPTLDDRERRVLGALIEKQISTPEYYPLTLQALTAACGQKNHRDPVMQLEPTTVAAVIERLKARDLAFTFHGADARVPRYGHRFADVFGTSPHETALLTVLMLRGPQTPGELRSRSGHLIEFEALSRVEETLQGLAAREEPLVVRLPRSPGTKESRWAHLLGGPVEGAAAAESGEGAIAPPPARPAPDDRLAHLETEVASLRSEVEGLRAELGELRKAFE